MTVLFETLSRQARVLSAQYGKFRVERWGVQGWQWVCDSSWTLEDTCDSAEELVRCWG